MHYDMVIKVLLVIGGFLFLMLVLDIFLILASGDLSRHDYSAGNAPNRAQTETDDKITEDDSDEV